MSGPAINITSNISDWAASAPDGLALIHGRRRVNFAQLDEAIRDAAAHFAGHGVTRGDVLPVLLSDQIGLAIAVLGAMHMGATPMPLSPGLTERQRNTLVRQVEPRFQVMNDRAMAAADVPVIPFDLTRLRSSGDRNLLDTRPAHPAKIHVGSGSTGEPLLIPISHATVHARRDTDVPALGFRPGERFMTTVPMAYGSPIDWLLETIPSGLTFMLVDYRKGLTASIEEGRPDYLKLTVYHAHRLLEEAETRPGFDLSRLKRVMISASPVGEPLRAALRNRLKARLTVIYGTNEAWTLTSAFPEDLDQVANTVGRPRPPLELEIIDSRDQPVKPGEIGQIRARGPGIFSGYVGGAAPERLRDGWFYPGDLGRWQDGQLVHCGRADQMMILNGINVYPAEIERCMERHPAVDEVAAFPLQHEIHGQIPVCAVTLRAGMQTRSGELEDHADRELGPHRPRRIVILDSMPRTAMGKLIRKDLVSLVQKKMPRAGY